MAIRLIVTITAAAGKGADHVGLELEKLRHNRLEIQKHIGNGIRRRLFHVTIGHRQLGDSRFSLVGQQLRQNRGSFA